MQWFHDCFDDFRIVAMVWSKLQDFQICNSHFRLECMFRKNVHATQHKLSTLSSSLPDPIAVVSMFKLDLLSMRVFHTESMLTRKLCVAPGNLCCRYIGGPGLVKLSLRFGHLLALRYVASVDLREGGAAQFLPIC